LVAETGVCLHAALAARHHFDLILPPLESTLSTKLSAYLKALQLNRQSLQSFENYLQLLALASSLAADQARNNGT
jgi:hypothetical protein